MNVEEIPDKYPVIERIMWIGKKEKLLEKFKLTQGKLIRPYSDPKFDVKLQLDNIEETGFPGQVFYTTEIESGTPNRMFPSEIKIEIKNQWVYVEDLEVTHFAVSL